MDTRKQAIIDALRVFVNKRPGFDTRNYGDAASYRSDSRMATRQRDDALRFLRDIELHDSISADNILKEAQSGRLAIAWRKAKENECKRCEPYALQPCGPSCVHVTQVPVVDYCAGQYWCTEFRGAVARLCASVLWTWKREQAMPTDTANRLRHPDVDTQYRFGGNGQWMSAGDYLRASFKHEYGRTLAGMYFS